MSNRAQLRVIPRSFWNIQHHAKSQNDLMLSAKYHNHIFSGGNVDQYHIVICLSKTILGYLPKNKNFPGQGVSISKYWIT